MRPDINDPDRNQWELEQASERLAEATGEKPKPQSRLEQIVFGAADRIADQLGDRLAKMFESQASKSVDALPNVSLQDQATTDIAEPVIATQEADTSLAADVEFDSPDNVQPQDPPQFAIDTPSLPETAVSNAQPLELARPAEVEQQAPLEISDVEPQAADLGEMPTADVQFPEGYSQLTSEPQDTPQIQSPDISQVLDASPEVAAEFQELPQAIQQPGGDPFTVQDSVAQASEPIDVMAPLAVTSPSVLPLDWKVDTTSVVSNMPVVNSPMADLTQAPDAITETTERTPGIDQRIPKWSDVKTPHGQPVRPAHLNPDTLPDVPFNAGGSHEAPRSTQYDPVSVGRGGLPPADQPSSFEGDMPSDTGGRDQAIEAQQAIVETEDAFDEVAAEIIELFQRFAGKLHELGDAIRVIGADLDRQGDER